MALKKIPEEREAAASGRKVSGLGTREPVLVPALLLACVCDYGLPIHLSGPLLFLYNKKMGFHSVRSRGFLLCLVFYSQQLE